MTDLCNRISRQTRDWAWKILCLYLMALIKPFRPKITKTQFSKDLMKAFTSRDVGTKFTLKAQCGRKIATQRKKYPRKKETLLEQTNTTQFSNNLCHNCPFYACFFFTWVFISVSHPSGLVLSPFHSGFGALLNWLHTQHKGKLWDMYANCSTKISMLQTLEHQHPLVQRMWSTNTNTCIVLYMYTLGLNMM